MSRPELRVVEGGQAQPQSVEGLPPPSDLGSEGDVLGEIFTHPELVAVARGILEPSDFYSEAHRQIFAAICDLDDMLRELGDDRPKEATVSVGLVLSMLKDRGQCRLELRPGSRTAEAATHRYLVELRDLRPSIWTRFEDACERIKGKARLREAARWMQRQTAELYTTPPNDVQAWLDGLAAGARTLAYAGRTVTLAAPGETNIRDALTPATNGRMKGLDTGIGRLNDVTGGWQNGELWLVTAPRGGGKSAFMLDQLVTVASVVTDGEYRDGGLFASLEMTRELCVLRMVLREALVDLSTGLKHTEKLTTEQWGKIDDARRAINALPILVDDRKRLTVDQIRGSAHRARKVFEQRGARLSFIAIDYFQLTGPNPRSGRNATEAQMLSDNGEELVQLAHELNVPILCGAQVRDDGEIAQCTAMARHAQNWLSIKLRPADSGPNATTLTLKKHRNGPPATVDELWFHGAYQRFSEDAWL